jgi:hypothetical protein
MSTEERTIILPLNHPLAGCAEKLWRAQDHLELLSSEIKKLGTGEIKPATFRTEFKRNRQDLVWTVVDTVNPPPMRLAVIIGDIVHNLRSSLDHLVFELAFLGKEGKVIPGVRSGFPCCYRRGGDRGWNSDYVQKEQLAGVLPEHRAVIYRAQPCYRRQDATAWRRHGKRSPVADLKHLWNEDKHRMVQTAGVIAATITPRIGPYTDCAATALPKIHPRFLGRPFEVGTEVLSIPIRVTGPNPNVRVDIDISGAVRLRNGFPIVEALGRISQWIGGAFEHFQPAFETPQARRLWDLPRGGWIERETYPWKRATLSEWTIEAGRVSAPG